MSGIEVSAIISEFASDSDNRADKAAQALAAAGSENLAIFSRLLIDQNADVRWWAVRSLAEIQSSEITPLLLQTLNDSDISVRQCAALALQEQPDSRAIPALIQSLNSADQLLARIAGNALVAIGGDAVPALLEVMENGPHNARLGAARALGLIGDTRAIPELIKALDGESAILEHWAGEGLEKMGVGMIYFKA
ncbi:MAG: HEAT repeat domain-containing protein [Anaerolineales bacterium]|nr:HEAT repeat domain-containing protein [Anaerolineales bacterium]